MIEMLKAKLHGLRVTQCNIDYHGSITIDKNLLEIVGIPIHSFVYVWNKSNGERIKTYVQSGVRNSGIVCINGAAARRFDVNDNIIVALPEFCNQGSSFTTILTIKKGNKPEELTIFKNEMTNSVIVGKERLDH